MSANPLSPMDTFSRNVAARPDRSQTVPIMVDIRATPVQKSATLPDYVVKNVEKSAIGLGLTPFRPTLLQGDTTDKLESDLFENPTSIPASASSTITAATVETAGGYRNRFRKGARWLGLWEHKISRFIRRHIVLFLSIFLVALVAGSIGVGWALRLRTFNAVDIDDPVLNANIYLTANLVTIDPSQQVMTLEWEVQDYQVGVDNNGNPILCDNQPSCPDLGIYFDANLLQTTSDGPGSGASNNDPSPTFILNGTNWISLAQGTDLRPSSPIFRTDVLISSDGTHRTAQSYPFDEYVATLAMFTQSLSDNSPVGMLVVKTSGIAAGFNAKLIDSGLGQDNRTYIKNIEVSRGSVIRVYAVFIVMAIWAVTLTFVVAGVTAVWLGKGIRADVLVLPVATLFAFTQLRGTLPGAPDGFGADIDFVGILPCLALLTTCSVFMTAVFLFRNPEVNTKRWSNLSVELGADSKV